MAPSLAKRIISLADLKVAYFQKYVKINLVTNVINNFEIFLGGNIHEDE